jgi:hypothetical protein
VRGGHAETFGDGLRPLSAVNDVVVEIPSHLNNVLFLTIINKLNI